MEEIEAKIANLEEKIELCTDQRDNEQNPNQKFAYTNEIAGMRIELAGMRNERAALINLQLQGKFPPVLPLSFPIPKDIIL